MYDIVGKRNWYFAFSLLITIPGLIFIILGGLKPSVDYTGGTVWQVHYAKTPTAAEVRAALVKLGHPEAVVRSVGGGFLEIRTDPIDLLPAITPAPTPTPLPSGVTPSPSPSPSPTPSPTPTPTPTPIADPLTDRVSHSHADPEPDRLAQPDTGAAHPGHAVRRLAEAAGGAVRPGRAAQHHHRRADRRIRADPELDHPDRDR